MILSKCQSLIQQLLKLGTHAQLDDGKKLAIQISNIDGMLGLVIFFIYSISSIVEKSYPFNLLQPLGFFVVLLGLLLIRKRFYDSGRVLIHFNALFQTFIMADSFPLNSGFEFYYITGIFVPFITFSSEESRKGLILSSIVAATLIVQEIIGTGHFNPLKPFLLSDKYLSLIIVLLYTIIIMSFYRRQVSVDLKEIKRKQLDLAHSSNLVALGEMSAGIAHEINNPLQALTLHTHLIRRLLEKNKMTENVVIEKLESMDKIIFNLARIVKAMKSLSRNIREDSPETFMIQTSVEEALQMTSARFEEHGVEFVFQGPTDVIIHCHSAEFTQVLLNLLNNAFDAIESLDCRWIKITVEPRVDYIEISVSDSGHGVAEEFEPKLMNPFFTTKAPGKGTGLGLSISCSLLQKWGGRLYYDRNSPCTRFVIEMPNMA